MRNSAKKNYGNLRHASFFHSSWFDKEPQTITNVSPATFSETYRAQIEFLKLNGYVIVRKSPEQKLTDIENLRKSVLNQLALSQSGIFYNFFRYFKECAVRAPLKRHSIPLDFASLSLMNVLSDAITNIRQLLDSQLSQKSPLVDLSSIIALPGAERQSTHTDIPYSNNNIILTGVVALSRVSLENGPTCLFAGSHTKAFHDRHVSSTVLDVSHYNPDGSHDNISTPLQKSVQVEIDEKEVLIVNKTTSQAAHAAILDPGDILLYNTQIFHYGGANISSTPRAILMFSFQQCTPWGSFEKVNGFTYNCHHSVKGKLRIDSFPISAS